MQNIARSISQLDELVPGLSARIDLAINDAACDRMVVQPQYSGIKEHSGKSVTLAGIEIVPNEEFDDDALPFFRGILNGGETILLGEEDLVPTSGPAEALVTLVCQIHAEARHLGFAGPFHLLEDGSPEQKQEFADHLKVVRLTRFEWASEESTSDPIHPNHPNRMPGADEMIRQLAESTEDTREIWWSRLNYLSQDIWSGTEDELQAIAMKAGRQSVQYAMELSMTLRDISEIVTPMLTSMPEGETKTQLEELLNQASKSIA